MATKLPYITIKTLTTHPFISTCPLLNTNPQVLIILLPPPPYCAQTLEPSSSTSTLEVSVNRQANYERRQPEFDCKAAGFDHQLCDVERMVFVILVYSIASNENTAYHAGIVRTKTVQCERGNIHLLLNFAPMMLHVSCCLKVSFA